MPARANLHSTYNCCFPSSRADDVEVVLVGHSIGAYIVLHLLDSVDWLHKSRGIMLFPTVHHIGELGWMTRRKCRRR